MKLLPILKVVLVAGVTVININHVGAIEPITVALTGAAISTGASLIGTTVNSLSGLGPNRNIVIEISKQIKNCKRLVSTRF